MKKGNKKKAAVILAAAFAVGAICFGGTAIGKASAYLSDDKQVFNTLTTGENTVETKETFNPDTKVTSDPSTTATPAPVGYDKVVTVENTGKTDAYVRVFLDFSDDTARNSSTIDGKSYKQFCSDHKGGTPWRYVDSGDLGGYFYYTKELNPGEKTEPLCSKVVTQFAKQSAVTDYSIIVSTESVQTFSKNGELFTGADPWKSAWAEYLAE